MKKTTFILAACILGMTSCNFIRIDGKNLSDLMASSKSKESISASSNYETRTFEVGEFRGIHAAGAFNVKYSRGTQNLKIYAPDNIMEHLTVEVRDGILKIGTDKIRIRNWKEVTVYVSVPELDEAHISGAGDFSAEEVFTSGNIDIKISGAGDIDIDKLTANDASISISGAGDIEIESLECNGISVKISGAGDASLAGKANTADLKISGAGDIDIRGLECPRVNTSVSGAGKVRQ